MTEMTKSEQKEFLKSVKRTDLALLEKMLRVGIFQKHSWETKIFVEKGCKKYDFTNTNPIRKLYLKIGRKTVIPYESAIDVILSGNYQVFLEYYNTLLVFEPWLVDVYTKEQLEGFVTQVLDKILTPEESKVIQLHFGFCGKPLNFKEISERLGVSHGYILAIKRDALLKIYTNEDYYLRAWYYPIASTEIVKDLISARDLIMKSAKSTYEKINDIESQISHLESQIAGLKHNFYYERAEKAKENVRLFTQIQPFKGVAANNITIPELCLSVRPYNVLMRAGFRTVEDLLWMTKNDILKLENLGNKSVDEIEEKLSRFGFKLYD